MIVNKINSNIPTKYANPPFKSYLPETLYKFSEKDKIKFPCGLTIDSCMITIFLMESEQILPSAMQNCPDREE